MISPLSEVFIYPHESLVYDWETSHPQLQPERLPSTCTVWYTDVYSLTMTLKTSNSSLNLGPGVVYRMFWTPEVWKLALCSRFWRAARSYSSELDRGFGSSPSRTSRETVTRGTPTTSRSSSAASCSSQIQNKVPWNSVTSQQRGVSTEHLLASVSIC